MVKFNIEVSMLIVPIVFPTVSIVLPAAPACVDTVFTCVVVSTVLDAATIWSEFGALVITE